MSEKTQAVGAPLERQVRQLPAGREHIAGMNRHFAKVCGTVIAYTEDDLLTYAAQAVADERERCAQAFESEVESWSEMRKAGYIGAIKRKGAAAIRAA